MIAEEQLFRAKVFVRSYRDAIRCLEQCAIKERVFTVLKGAYLGLQEEEHSSLKSLSFSK